MGLFKFYPITRKRAEGAKRYSMNNCSALLWFDYLRRKTLALFAASTGLFWSAALLAAAEPAQPKYIENDFVRLGVDLASGGGVFYFSQVRPKRNLVNHKDKGRLIQQSYYGDEDGSLWSGKKWRWNPVQGGNYQDKPSKILSFKHTRGSLFVKTQPKHWATGEDIKDAVMEETIVLNGPVAHLHFRFHYFGSRTFNPRHQELPAVFVDYTLSKLVFYNGRQPWTEGTLTTKTPLFPNEYYGADEEWAAYVDENGWGLGAFFPGTSQLTCYRYKGDASTDSDGDGTSYFAPIQTLGISPGWTFEYDLYITIGTLEEIRARFAALRVPLKESLPEKSKALITLPDQS